MHEILGSATKEQAKTKLTEPVLNGELLNPELYVFASLGSRWHLHPRWSYCAPPKGFLAVTISGFAAVSRN